MLVGLTSSVGDAHASTPRSTGEDDDVDGDVSSGPSRATPPLASRANIALASSADNPPLDRLDDAAPMP
tara:strand:+ start:608 stop:814 length:207 start_codon:yes stop_codon:yes gene_type:complete